MKMRIDDKTTKTVDQMKDEMICGIEEMTDDDRLVDEYNHFFGAEVTLKS